MAASARFVLRFLDIDTGVGWTISGKTVFATLLVEEVVSRIDPFLVAYLAQCHDKVRFMGVTYAPLDGVGIQNTIAGNFPGWSGNEGQIAAAHIPQASRAFLLVGTAGAGNKGQSHFWLHGIPDEQLNASGELPAANSLDIRTEMQLLFFQYRVGDPTPPLGVVDPPSPFAQFQNNGFPYERKLGFGVPVPGVQRHYTRETPPSP